MDDDQRDREGEQPAPLWSGRVRIVGAEPAGKGAEAGAPEPAGAGLGADPGPGQGTDGGSVGAAPLHALPGGDGFGAPLPKGADVDLSSPFGSGAPPAGPEGFPSPVVPDDDPSAGTELPHWTEAPTGEVPAVLARETGDQSGAGADPWSSLPAPTWREEHTDWTAQEETFEPSMLAHDDARLGSLDDSGASDLQPWSFDLPASGEAPEVPGTSPAGFDDYSDQDTMVVPVVRPSGAAPAPDDVAFRFDETDEPAAAPPVRPPARSAETAAIPNTATPNVASPEPSGSQGTAIPPVVVAVPDDDGDLAPPPVLVDGEDAGGAGERRARRSGRGVGRPGRRRARSAPETRLLTQAPSTGLDGGGELDDPGEDTTVGPTPPRPVPQAGTVADAAPPSEGRPVPEPPASRAGRPVPQDGRPVPQAPQGPRRSPPRPRPGTGLRPPGGPRETRSGRDLPVAVVSGLILGIVALVFFDLGTITAMIVATAVVTLAAVEAYAAFRKAGYRPATLLGLVATVSLMVATYNKGQEALPLVLVLVFAFTILWHLIGVDRGAEPVRSTAATLLVFCWVGVFGSFGALLLDPTLFPSRHGIAFLLGAVITAVAYDVGALAVGAWIGSHPLSEASPGKTWEGAAGGAVAAVLVAVVFVHLIHPWTVGAALALGVAVAVVSPIGDLSESLVKRHLGLKDMGRILPGHGGLLDRIDGLLFVLPATYYLVKAFHLG